MPRSLPECLGEFVVDGLPTWIYSDGTHLPVVRGGADDGGSGGGTGDGDKGGSGGQGGDPPDLGDAGKKALADERAARKAAEKARKAADKKAADYEAELTKLRGDNQTEQEKALDQARKEAGEEARKGEVAKANRRIVTAEVKAAAGTKLADPSDAVRLLDLDEFAVSDDGEVDEKAIASAIADLLKDKPYLAAKGATSGSADGGARNSGGAGDEPVSAGVGRLRRAYANTKQ